MLDGVPEVGMHFCEGLEIRRRDIDKICNARPTEVRE